MPGVVAVELAFSNWDAPSMYNAAAAEEGWARTLDFFSRHLQA